MLFKSKGNGFGVVCAICSDKFACGKEEEVLSPNCLITLYAPIKAKFVVY